MRLKKGPLAFGVVVAVIGGGAAGLFIALRKRNQAATAIIQQLALMLGTYEGGLQAFVDKELPGETPEDQFEGINAFLKIDTSPWDIHSEVDGNDPGTLNVFVGAAPELIAHLRHRLRFTRLPVVYSFVDETGASLGIHLQVTNPVLVESARLKLGLDQS